MRAGSAQIVVAPSAASKPRSRPVQAGLAYARLPEHLLEESLKRGTLKPLPLVSGGTRSLQLHLVVVKPEPAGPAVRAAIEVLLSGTCRRAQRGH